MKKQTIICISIILLLILSVILLNSPVFTYENNFWINNVAFFITIILSTITYLMVKNYSKPIAASGSILLVFIYTLFAWAIELDSQTFSRIAIILTQTAIIIFAMICGTVTQEKTKKRIKKEVSKYIADQVLDSIDEETPQTTKGKKENLTIMFIDIRGFTHKML